MNKVFGIFVALFLIPTVAFACFDIDSYSWQKKPDKVVDIPTETELYTDTQLKDASQLIIKAQWTGARKTREINEQIVTVSQLKVNAVYKGNKKLKNTKIDIIEPAYQYEGILNRYDGYEFLQEKKYYKLYLKSSKGNWIITGVTQGKKEL